MWQYLYNLCNVNCKILHLNDLYALALLFILFLILAALNSEYGADNKALLLLLKGACLRQMGSPLQAEECLKEVVSLEKKIKEDSFLVPYALVEMALLLLDQGNAPRAAQILEDTK